MVKVEIYDTTLRDGAQGEGISFSVEDAIRIALKLDQLGVHYIEGGWPGSSPKHDEFFQDIKNYDLGAQIAAFGSTHHPRATAEQDANLAALLNSGAQVITIFGKSWDLHVIKALNVKLERNLEIIRDSLNFLRSNAKTLFYDAEHFFDGYKANPEYALKTILQAVACHVDCIIFCDTNGGLSPEEMAEILDDVKPYLKKIPFGVHCHNDGELAVANSLMAARMGASQIQGTINGYGERCGNANLCSIIPNLALKRKVECSRMGMDLRKLVETSRFVDEIANISPRKNQPFVGASAFAHKGGVHVHAVNKVPETYEHIKPEEVGNKRRFLVSDLSGKSTVLHKAKQYGLNIGDSDPALALIIGKLKTLENKGYQFEGAEASFELLMRRALAIQKQYFTLCFYRVTKFKTAEGKDGGSEATVMLTVGGKERHEAAMGYGQVNALDLALRKCLENYYPDLKQMKLHDYKVRVIPNGKNGTESNVRVNIETKDQHSSWETIGVSTDIIDASWEALIDSFEYFLMNNEERRKKTNTA